MQSLAQGKAKLSPMRKHNIIAGVTIKLCFIVTVTSLYIGAPHQYKGIPSAKDLTAATSC